MKYYVEIAGRGREVEIRSGPEGLEVLVDGAPHPVDLAEIEGSSLYSLLVDGSSHSYAARFENGDAVLSFHDRDVELKIEDERTRLAHQATGGKRAGSGAADIKSVMPGVVKELRCEVGQQAKEGEPLLILEAMKMENEIRAPRDGTVAAIHVEAGQAVEKGATLVSLGTE